MSAPQKYILKETAISSVINALFSVLFVFVVFGGQSSVSLQGASGLLFDSIPQGIAIGFMGAFFPSFLTRKRIATGALSLPTRASTSSFLPLMPVLRALLFAIAGALVSLAVFAVPTFVIGIATLTFLQVLLLKTLWGALLGAGVSYIALRAALHDYPGPKGPDVTTV